MIKLQQETSHRAGSCACIDRWTILPAALAILLIQPLTVTPAVAQQFVQETATRFPTPNPTDYTNQITIGDIDNDGDLDILFGNGAGFNTQQAAQPLRVYANDGAGFFTDVTTNAAPGITGWFRGVELGDADNDGDLDVVLAQDFDEPPDLLINDGTGQFTSEGATRLPAITLASSRAQFGDVDNDGNLDLFFVSGTDSRFDCGQYRLYLNNGSGFFTDVTSTQFPIGDVCNNMDCIFADIDNDFSIDIRTASTGTNNSRLYRNDGRGTFMIDNTVPGDSSAYSYDFGDIDNDGDLDMMGANAGTSNTELLLQNDGNGTFTNVSAQLLTNPNIDDNDSKFFDYDNDGDLDLIVGALGGTAERIYNNDGSGVFTLTSGVITSQPDSTLDIMVADLTGNGKLDIVTGQGESGNFQNRIYINNGPADTIPPTIIKTEVQPNTGSVTSPFVVRALITDQMTSDRNFFDKGITLHYSINGDNQQSVPMRYSGGQVYRGVIPNPADSALVEYYVTATDFADNTGIGQEVRFVVIGSTFDQDEDGDIDLVDFAKLENCLLGPEFTYPVDDSCLIHDADGDFDVDLNDYGRFMLVFTN